MVSSSTGIDQYGSTHSQRPWETNLGGPSGVHTFHGTPLGGQFEA